MQCYGNAGNSYIILCIGTGGDLWSRQGLDAPWQKVNDNVGGNLKSICVGNDGKTIYGTTIINTIWTKTSWDAPNWNALPNTQNCCVLSLAQGQDGTFVGVGTDNVLYSNTTNMFSGTWSRTASQGEQGINSVTIPPDGTLLVSAGGNIYKKNSYKNLPSQQWQGVPNTCCVKSITIAPDGTLIGVGMDNQLYTKANYKDLSTPWSGPWSSENSSCCAISVAAVVNPNYNVSNYNQTSSPNYNINQQPMTSVKGAIYSGASNIGQNASATLQECQASCARTAGCTGATFNVSKNGQPVCRLGGEDGSIVRGLPGDYAIVPKAKHLLYIIQNINQQLTNINKQIQKKTSSGQTLYDEQTRQRGDKRANLISQFIQLTEERNKIDEMITDYQTLDQQQTQGNIAINQNYYSFVVLLFLAIIVILGLLYFGGKTNTSSNTSLINLNSQPQVSSTLSTSYIVITGILFSLIIVCISIVITRTGANSSGLYKLFENIIPSTFPELQISKFGWS